MSSASNPSSACSLTSLLPATSRTTSNLCSRPRPNYLRKKNVSTSLITTIAASLPIKPSLLQPYGYFFLKWSNQPYISAWGCIRVGVEAGFMAPKFLELGRRASLGLLWPPTIPIHDKQMNNRFVLYKSIGEYSHNQSFQCSYGLKLTMRDKKYTTRGNKERILLRNSKRRIKSFI